MKSSLPTVDLLSAYIYIAKSSQVAGIFPVRVRVTLDADQMWVATLLTKQVGWDRSDT